MNKPPFNPTPVYYGDLLQSMLVNDVDRVREKLQCLNSKELLALGDSLKALVVHIANTWVDYPTAQTMSAERPCETSGCKSETFVHYETGRRKCVVCQLVQK